MSGILPELIKALSMASSLPWYAALPVYVVSYGAGFWVLAQVVYAAGKAYKTWRDALKK